MKPVKMWAVFSPKGKMDVDSIATTRNGAKERFCYSCGCVFAQSWLDFGTNGYTVRRVVVTEVEHG